MLGRSSRIENVPSYYWKAGTTAYSHYSMAIGYIAFFFLRYKALSTELVL